MSIDEDNDMADAFIDDEAIIREEILEDDGNNQFEDQNEEEEDENDQEDQIMEEEPELTDVEEKATAKLQYHTDSVYAVSVAEVGDEILIAGGSGDDRGSFLRLNKNIISTKSESPTVIDQPTLYLDKHSDSVTAIEFNFNATLIASGDLEGNVNVWNVQGGEPLSISGPTDSIEWINWHPKGNVFVCGSGDGTAWMWNAKGDCLNVFSGHEASVSCGQFTPDGKMLVTGSHDKTVKVWTPTIASASVTLQGDLFHTAPIFCLDCKPDAPIIVSGAEDGSLRLSNFSSSKVLQKYEDHSDSVEAVKFSNVISAFVSASMDGTMKVWDINSGQLRSNVLAHEGGVVKILTHPTEPLVYSCGVDCKVNVWDVRMSTCVHSFTGHTKNILDFDISKDGKSIFTSSDDKTIRVFTF